MAETASSHEGDPALAVQLLRAAVAAGADLVKFQLLRGDMLLTPDHPKYGAFQQIQMPDSAWVGIADAAADLNARLVAEVFDEPSLALAVRLRFPALKIHSTDLSNPRMLEGAAASGLPIFVSTGGATCAEIAAALGHLDAHGARQVVLLHGFQAFPTRLVDSNLRQLWMLRSRFGRVVGYADHVDAETELAFVLPAMALGAGARVVEKHITLDRAKRGRDYFSALNPPEFTRLVTLLRDADLALGRADDTLSPPELAYRALMKKTVVAAAPLAPGVTLEPGHLAFKRAPMTGFSPMEAASLLGRRIYYYDTI